jgi:hypothetical protein
MIARKASNMTKVQELQRRLYLSAKSRAIGQPLEGKPHEWLDVARGGNTGQAVRLPLTLHFTTSMTHP